MSTPAVQPRNFTLQDVLDTMGEGVYVVDRERRILYWSKSAERLTGWTREDVAGKACWDNLLCHADKDGHQLCGEEHCPLYRSIITGKPTRTPVIAYAQHKQGHRVPFEVSISPLRNEQGDVVAAVESFRDITDSITDLERARHIQRQALPRELPVGQRVRFRVHYQPHEMIGGDFYALKQLDDGRFAIFMADVMGHGLPAALHTMYLRSLWHEHQSLLDNPVAFMCALNDGLHSLLHGDDSYATGVLLLFDERAGELAVVGGGHCSPLVFRADGAVEKIDASALPLGLLPDAPREVSIHRLAEGDALVVYTDGAIEVMDSTSTELGEDGLARLLSGFGAPGVPIPFERLDQELLAFSNTIRLEDDVMVLEMRVTGPV
ncbi:MAG: SpoIIE family protein phosphatase [Candidatus Sumerlaeia bacterium]|nr:SpoIIE family protein phosphatase [Candidatus Sumerlaeia bacterium]